jgi:holo-[acyl-carrier protein] synthase
MHNKILGIGIDSVEIERFANWASYSPVKLSRIFSPEEIKYCLECPTKSAERFAARFAAREAFLKALHQALPSIKIPLLTLCRAITIIKSANGAPHIVVDWKLLKLEQLHSHISWTHTKTVATAIVLI